MRQPKVFERQRRHGVTYYVEIAGQQHNLGTDKAEAFRKYGALLAEEKPAKAPAGPLLVVDLIDQFLAHLEKTAKAPATFKWYSKHLTHKRTGFKTWLLANHKRLAVASLKPAHVEDWILAKYTKGDNHKIGGIRSISRACNWARKRGMIPTNPVADTERPAATSRDIYIDPANWKKLMAAIEPGPFRDVVQFMRLTGARPHEVEIAQVKHFEPQSTCLVFERVNSKGKKERRVVQLGTGEALAIVKRLAEVGEGRLFRTPDGEPWTNDAFNRECDRYEKLVGFKFYLYAIRHTFITDALYAGVDPIKVANIVGHKDLKMIMQTYSHLNLKSQQLRDVVDQINAA